MARFGCSPLQELDEQLELPLGLDHHVRLADRRDRRVLVLVDEADVDRVDQVRRAPARGLRGGIVADRSSVWRGCGTALRIVSTAGRKPMSSIWSASSSTTIFTLSSRIVCRAIRSIRRPAWRRPAGSRRPADAAGQRSTRRRRSPTARRAGRRRASRTRRAIWITSSRVGARIRACGSRPARRSSRGSGSGTRRSCPSPSARCPGSRARRWPAGIRCAWIGLGSTYRTRTRAACVVSSTPSSRNPSEVETSFVVVCKLSSLSPRTCGADRDDPIGRPFSDAACVVVGLVAPRDPLRPQAGCERKR